MNIRQSSNARLNISAAAIAAVMTAGCASNIEGTFEPACIAYEGDRIELKDGRFEWDRFTDAINVDEDGNRMDPFPGFPKTGRFEQDSERLAWIAEDGSELGERYLLEHRGRTYLLTYDQNEAVLDGENMPACALVLVNNDD